MTRKYIQNGTAIVARDYTDEDLEKIANAPENQRPIFLNETDQSVLAFIAAQPSAATLMWGRIKNERDRRKEAGGTKVGTKWFHSDTSSRIQFLGLVLMGANLPVNIQWKTMDGTFVAMTPVLAGQIFSASAAADMAIFAAAEAHKQTMQTTTDPTAYDYLAGWPAVYGDLL